MAKAALEAINGFNLFGSKGASWSVTYVDIDAHNRNRSIFETLLPRESDSKSVDAALLATVSFPAFATHDRELYGSTKARVIEKLKGSYGFKRFNRDGLGCAVDNPDGERYYPEGKIQEFSGVESEWPMFYAFLVIDGVFKGSEKQVQEYQRLLRARIAYDKQGGMSYSTSNTPTQTRPQSFFIFLQIRCCQSTFTYRTPQ